MPVVDLEELDCIDVDSQIRDDSILEKQSQVLSLSLSLENEQPKAGLGSPVRRQMTVTKYNRSMSPTLHN